MKSNSLKWHLAFANEASRPRNHTSLWHSDAQIHCWYSHQYVALANGMHPPFCGSHWVEIPPNWGCPEKYLKGDLSSVNRNTKGHISMLLWMPITPTDFLLLSSLMPAQLAKGWNPSSQKVHISVTTVPVTIFVAILDNSLFIFPQGLAMNESWL